MAPNLSGIAAVDATNTGEEIGRIVDGLAKRYRIGAIDELKTAPKGYPKDHPRIDLLRRKGLMMSLEPTISARPSGPMILPKLPMPKPNPMPLARNAEGQTSAE